MKANDILRRMRYILDLDDAGMVAVFAAAEQPVTGAEVRAWLKKDDDPDYGECSDRTLAAFLNGLINQKRGRQDGPQPAPEDRLNNNAVLRKLKIAFNLQADEMLSLLSMTGVQISKHELSAFFRRPGHKHYRDCKDQVLRNFLQGLQIRHRGDSQHDGEDELTDTDTHSS